MISIRQTASTSDFSSFRRLFLRRVIDSAHEKDRPGRLITDQEEKRTVGLEFFRKNFSSYHNNGRTGGFAALFIHFSGRKLS
jgi:hypothetical protein